MSDALCIEFTCIVLQNSKRVASGVYYTLLQKIFGFYHPNIHNVPICIFSILADMRNE